MTISAASLSHSDLFLPYMRDVARSSQAMLELGQHWRMIEASAKMGFAAEAQTLLPIIAATRSSFHQLEQDLIANLVREKVANVLHELGTKAHYVIDIVVRNLYERTADIGFLATDRELCAFVAGLPSSRSRIRDRLHAYRSKYTVYDEIILLDRHGKVLANLDERLAVTHTSDPLLAQSLESDAYVETFRATDLCPGKKQALIYSRRMLHPETRAVVGVLCLCFAFDDEMATIFRTHRDPGGRSNMLLLDSDNRVIASADGHWIPVGATVPVNRDSSPECLLFGGRAYLAATVSAVGYQGYRGPPGWQGQVMIPLDVAFTTSHRSAAATLDPAIAEGVLSHAGTFCPQLQTIQAAADVAAETIQRVVWNGKIMSAGGHDDALRLRAILDQISETGAGSNALFSTSIQSLYETVLASSLNQSEFVSHLLVDLLDRNLYERADDCRWWALTPDLRAILANPARDPPALAGITAMLDHINQLYTVYARIVVYDRTGTIIASSRADAGGETPVGTKVDAIALEQVRLLRDDQGYHVSPFEPTGLYDGEATYVYHAAIRHPENDAMVVGGIGIVFDAGVEFRAMLSGGIGGKENTEAFFVDRGGRIIAGTQASKPIGSLLPLDADLLALPGGSSLSRIIVHDDTYAMVGCTASSGYREFKNSDGYREDVIAVVVQSLGSARPTGVRSQRVESPPVLRQASGDVRQFATFFVDDALFALPVDHAVEALPASAVSRVSMGSRRESIGLIRLAGRHGGEESFVSVFDLGYLVRGTPSPTDANSSVVIVRHGEQRLGLLVSALHSLLAFSHRQITANPLLSRSGAGLVSGVVTFPGTQHIMQVIDPDHLFHGLRRQKPPCLEQDAGSV